MPISICTKSRQLSTLEANGTVHLNWASFELRSDEYLIYEEQCHEWRLVRRVVAFSITTRPILNAPPPAGLGLGVAEAVLRSDGELFSIAYSAQRLAFFFWYMFSV